MTKDPLSLRYFTCSPHPAPMELPEAGPGGIHAPDDAAFASRSSPYRRFHRSRKQEPAMHNPPVREEMNNRRPTPRRYCLLVLRGAPFIICSNCFRLLQLPSGFAIPNRGICGLQCGSCSEVLSYSYRDPYRMKRQSSYGDECSADDEDSTDDFGTRRTFVQEISRDRNALGRAAASPSPPPPPPPRCQAADDDLRVTVAAAALQLIQFQAQWKKGRFLGSGSFGQVYLGVNSENDQFCAIKEVQFTLDDPHSKERLKQINREIDMLRHLSHPNIVQYYESDLHLTDHVLSIYLEYVPNGSIHTILQKYGPFKEPMIRNYTGQILSGLAYLHGKKTVHRDIKGANILVGPNGEVKLSDFGMAKHISSFAEIHSLKGSAKWMAPEVIMSNYSGEGYNLAVDIWSLGCTVIEMATARPPWHQYEPVAAIFKIAHSKDIPDIPDILSEEGKSFLQLCLERDPASRPSALQLMDHPFVQDRPAM